MRRSVLSPPSFTSKRAVSPNPYLDNPVNGGYSRPSGVALHYDDVPINGMVRHTTNAGHSHQNGSFFVLSRFSFFPLFTSDILKLVISQITSSYPTFSMNLPMLL